MRAPAAACRGSLVGLLKNLGKINAKSEFDFAPSVAEADAFLKAAGFVDAELLAA